ncbi:MAG: hypothetical protein GVY13_13705 [Alphaproteobacteria bacterium]|jgi:hypothetical protein|nr:hypothetical protein [Alphaproteobacteria bacterium]
MTANLNLPEMSDQFLRLAVSQPLTHWLAVQGEVYARMGEMAESWGRNRVEDATAAENAVRRLADGPDRNQVAAIYSDLLQGAMHRAANDVSQLALHGQAILAAGLSGARQVTAVTADAGREATVPVAKAAQ